MRKVLWLLGRARQLLQTEGSVSLLRRGFLYVFSSAGRFFFAYGNYYLYQHATGNTQYLNEAAFIPRIDNFTFKIISTNLEIGELEVEGLEFGSQAITVREGIAIGGIAFCVFVGPDLAHIGWVAMTEEARRAADNLPYRVDFGNGQACTGGTVTTPKYRGKGLMAYGYFKRLQFLSEKGVRTSRNAVDTSNIASQKVHAKFNPEIYARGHYLKILWWRSWKEKPLT